MKRIIPFIFFGFILLVGTSSHESEYYEYSEYLPVFMTRGDLDASVAFKAEPVALENPGKIYYKAPYLYINEKYRGVHIIDNSNPHAPVNRGFITIPGCIDMAVKGDQLYADNAVDLVSVDLTTRTLSYRLRNVLPEPLSPNAETFYAAFHKERPANFILVGWRKNPNYNKD